MATTSNDAISNPGPVSEQPETLATWIKVEPAEKDAVTGWKEIPTGIRDKTLLTENSTRRLISLAIAFVFVAWALVGGYYLMFAKGDLQVLIDGSAFISGPLGVVIGYYFGVGDDPKRR